VTTAQSRSSDDKVRVKAVIGSTKDGKKPRVTRIARVNSVGEQEASSVTNIPQHGEKSVAAVPKGDGGTTEGTSAGTKIGAKARQKRLADANEPRRTRTPEPTTHERSDDSPTEILGPSLVAGALGRKLGDARTAAMINGIVECRVELLSTRTSKEPVLAAPANSAESNSVTECVGASDARLSLFATDQNIQLELPGDVSERNKEMTADDGAKKTNVMKTMGEVTIGEPRRISLTSVKKVCDEGPLRDEASDRLGVGKVRDGNDAGAHANVEPTNLRTVEISVKAIAATEIRSSELEMVSAEATTRGKSEGERKRALRDIDIAMAMREHLATTNTELDTVTSFLGAVCGRPTVRRDKRRDIAPLSDEVAMEVETVTAPPSDQRIPDSASTTKQMASTDAKDSGDRYKGSGGDVESDSDREEAAVVILDETEISVGESSGEESRSRSSDGGSSSGSWRSRASRKRAAEDSPDRDYYPPARQAFPGVVSRGKSGCRIYVPSLGTVGNEAKRNAMSISGTASAEGRMTATTDITEVPIAAVCVSAGTDDETVSA